MLARFPGPGGTMKQETTSESKSATRAQTGGQVGRDPRFRAVRRARITDTAAIVALINRAYEVERFFVEGPRTTEESIRGLIQKGEMLALDGNRAELFVTAHLRCDNKAGHLGLISVHPSSQREGLGRRIIAVAEGLASANGCQQMKLQVVNLRTELVSYYRDLGYRETGTSEFADPQRALQPVHFIDMEKSLGVAN